MKNRWFLAYKRRGEDIYDFSNMKIIMPPEGRYYADPFLLGDVVYFEDYDYKKGVISNFQICPGGEGIIGPILETHHHLSFPHVFRDNGRLFMVPEEGAINKIQLYELTIKGWNVVKIIKEGIHAGDTQIAKVGDEWRLWTTNANDNKLYEMRVDTLLGDWEFVSEKIVDNSRPAGRVYEHEGRWLRPVQDTSEQYGARVIIKDVETGDVVRTLEPDWYPKLTGFHTFNFNDDWVVIDGRIDNE